MYAYLSRCTNNIIVIHSFTFLVIYKQMTWPLHQRWKKWLLYVPNFILVDYLTAPFNLLTWSEVVRFMQAWSYWGHIVIIVALWVLLILPSQPAPAVVLA